MIRVDDNMWIAKDKIEYVYVVRGRLKCITYEESTYIVNPKYVRWFCEAVDININHVYDELEKK